MEDGSPAIENGVPVARFDAVTAIKNKVNRHTMKK